MILRRVAWTVAAASGLLVMACALLLVSIDAGYWRRPVLRLVAARAGRPVTVTGKLHFHLWSRQPRIDAEGVTIGNPPWSPPGSLAVIDRLTVVLRLPTWHAPLEIERLEMQGATVDLLRDEDGKANWQRSYPPRHAGASATLIRSLLLPAARVTLHDDRHHLYFRGIVSVGEQGQAGRDPLLEIRGGGVLNDRPVGLDLLGQPLRSAVRNAPYRFTFDERSGESHLSGRGELAQAFDFAVIDADCEAAGPNLKDLYYLTGVHLIDTGKYQLTGHIARRGLHSTFSALEVLSGASDLHGSVAVDASVPRRRLSIDLYSHVLRLADVGARAAAPRAGAAAEPPLLVPTKALNLTAIRKVDSKVSFHGERVLATHAVLESVLGKMTIEKGVIDVPSLSGRVLDGRFAASLRIDAQTDRPPAQFELDLADLQLHRGLEGTLQAHIKLDGHGISAHDVMASASGTATARVGAGAIREALAEIAGVDLRGIGLMLSRNSHETAVRCGRARFEGHDGLFTLREAAMDTEPVAIMGSGTIDFGPETLDLLLYGQPKELRLLRLDAPIRVSGTLRKPAVALQTHGAKLKLIDRGQSAVIDCDS